VATPIGNLEDITSAALRVLGEVQAVAAEDTRRTRRLLDHFGLSMPVAESFEHNERVACRSWSSGSPPANRGAGDRRRLAGRRRSRVTAVCAPRSMSGQSRSQLRAERRVAALQVSGLPTDAFTSRLLCRSSPARPRAACELAGRRETVVVFETPASHRGRAGRSRGVVAKSGRSRWRAN
jgi:16S rRNA (cytidine1402-2'-O)-methyltransferase